MIELKDLNKQYRTPHGSLTAIESINLKIREGEIFGIIGPSGAGKSTLIRTLNLLEKPTSGRILINGQDITALSSKALRKKRQKIGMIFQHFNLLSSRTVRDNICFSLEIAGVARAKQASRVERLMELVDLTDRADHYPAQLSGGQKQRVGIARALANQPELLLSDEATSSLDPESTESVLKLLAKIRDELKLTVVLITHEMEVIKQVCDRVAVLEKGKVIEQGKVIDIFANPVQPLTRRFIKSVIDFNLPTNLIDEHNSDQLIRVSFLGKSTHQPLISSLVRKYGVNANILYGKIDDIQGTPFGTLVLKLEGEEKLVKDGVAYLNERGLSVEVLNHG